MRVFFSFLSRTAKGIRGGTKIEKGIHRYGPENLCSALRAGAAIEDAPRFYVLHILTGTRTHTVDQKGRSPTVVASLKATVAGDRPKPPASPSTTTTARTHGQTPWLGLVARKICTCVKCHGPLDDDDMLDTCTCSRATMHYLVTSTGRPCLATTPRSSPAAHRRVRLLAKINVVGTWL